MMTFLTIIAMMATITVAFLSQADDENNGVPSRAAFESALTVASFGAWFVGGWGMALAGYSNPVERGFALAALGVPLWCAAVGIIAAVRKP